MILFDTPLYQFESIEQDQILLFKWKETTKDMNFLNFQEACMIYAGLAIEHDIKNLLIDTTEFYYELPEDYMDWKNKNLNPRYAKVPIKKHAFLMKSEGFEAFANQEFEESTYLNKFFKEQQKAVNWLLN